VTARDADEAVANANRYTSYDVGMCLKWVRGPCWEVGSFYGSAIDAWNGAAHKHPGDRNPPKGAPCFYRGGSYGHIVIANGGPIRSTDCQSSGRVSDAALSWPETAWGDDYLGWTEDLNGVNLPLEVKEDDDMPYSDWPDKDRQALAADVAEAVWTELLKGQDSAPDGRRAAATLSGIRNLVEDMPEAVWKRLLMGQDSAPDGRHAGSTLSGVRDLVEKIAKAVGA
jgi:hypothetical protein